MKQAGNRRLFERVESRLQARLIVGETTIDVTTQDISLGGACITGSITAASGSSSILAISGWPPITSRVINSDGHMIRLQFALDEETRRRIEPFIGGLRGRLAA